MLRIRWLARTGIEQFMHLDHPFIIKINCNLLLH